MNTRAIGIEGETIACDYLKSLNYVILERNYSNKRGEIDIITRDREYIVFIEVKSRNYAKYGSPIERVTPEKITKIVKCAELYLLSKGAYDKDCRFDIIEIIGDQVTDHIKNAFSRADCGRKRHW